jgi:regulatory protein|tara:strand:+ start:12155 stop:12793 length:639 start_codon:yes stop_codon:yes gene_type:complete
MLTKKNKVLSVCPRKNLFIVEFVDGSIYELSKDIVISESIYEGIEISNADFEKILDKHKYHQAQSAGLNLLSYRMRSKKELSNKLINKNIDTSIVAQVVAKFEMEGWINDFEFGIAFSKDHINRNSIGPIALKYKLKEYIDSDDLINSVMENIYKELSMEEIIFSILKRFNPEEIRSDNSLKQKLVNKLKRKGHYWNDISDSINQYIEQAPF